VCSSFKIDRGKSSVTIAILVLVVSFLLFLYLRHVPVFGIGKKDINDVSSLKEDTIVVDVRDYQTSFREPIHQAYRIPFPYLKRLMIIPLAQNK
jgi:hypothetical protein